MALMENLMAPESESEASFWNPSSESEKEGSIWIPSSDSEGSFWKPSFSAAGFTSTICNPSPFWKGNSIIDNSVFGFNPSSSESQGSIPRSSSSSSSESQAHHPSLDYKIIDTWSNWYCDEPIETVRTRFRRDIAKKFRNEYKYEHGKKTLVRSNGIYTWPAKCYNLVWVAVHGMDSVCLVTRNQDVDMKRVGSYYQRYYTNEQTLRSLTEALISEIECLPYDDDEFRGKGIEKPFSVFSVIRNTTKVNAFGLEDSSDEYDEKEAIAYLEEKMKCPKSWMLKKTIRRAIYAFEILCRQEFFAEDIWVTVLDGKGRVWHLELLAKMRHLAVVGGLPLLSTTAPIGDDLW